jgi:Ni,Fe-hydrogenase III large subunit/Ni,Fe-hydrogenase III component G
MAILDAITHSDVADRHRPWPRAQVSDEGWRQAIDQLATGRLVLLGLWGDAPAVHMALLDEPASDIAVISYTCKSGKYPSVGARHAPAIRLERAISDLFGLEAVNAPDLRPWLDLGFWGVRHPLGKKTVARKHAPYNFLPAEGEGLHQIPVGPVHAGIIERGISFHGQWRARGAVGAASWLGAQGIEVAHGRATLEQAAKLAARTSGDSTVAYAFAFAQAAEAAMQIKAPLRAIYLRALMAELERLANHFGDIGAICNDASFSLMQAQCAILRERTLRAAASGFGHRLMMDVIVPGGLSRDIAPEGLAEAVALVATVRDVFPDLTELYDNTASLQDRTVTTGIVKPELAAQFGAGGYVGRASGRTFDARRALAYAPYDKLSFEVPVLEAGDVNARIWLRIREVEQSLSLIEQILGAVPAGAIKAPLGRAKSCEGLGFAEAFRGDVLVWLRINGNGRVARCHLRDASWFQWPLLEAAIEGNIVADFPLCNKSFNCSYSGHDL